jgi:hypothetical protein
VSRVKSIKILLYLLPVVFSFSCSTENSIRTEYRYLTDVIKPFEFLTNSYWVFQNDSTGAIDSITVTGTEKDFCTIFPGAGGSTIVYGEFFKMYYKSSYTQKSYNEYLLISEILQEGPGGGYCYSGQPIYAPGHSVGFVNDGMSVIESFPILMLNGNLFKNVDKIKITKGEQRFPAFDNDTYLFFADSVGIIKKEIFNSLGNIESWSLLNCKLIR